MRTPAVAIILAMFGALALAGCSESGGKRGDSDAASRLDDGAESLDLQATSTTGIIRGVVVDEAIRPVPDALVVLVANGKNATTNPQGAFGFEDLAPGIHFLTVAHPGYTAIQTSVDVVAGDDDPTVLRVQLKALPFLEPSFEVLHHQAFLTASSCQTPTFCTTCCDFLFNEDSAQTYEGLTFSAKNGTRFIQVLTVWDPTSDTARGAFVSSSIYAADELVSFTSTTQTGPVALDFRASRDAKLANATGPLEVRGTIFASDPDAPQSIGLAVQQLYDVYAIATVHFEPPEGWRYDRDGDPVLPKRP